jgi:hypothetical protein
VTTHADIVATARSWMDVPFEHQGRTRHGVDCVGLLVVVARAHKLSKYDFLGYNRRPDGTLLAHFAGAAKRLQLTAAGPGDIVVLADKNHPCHAAILAERAGQRTIIHALARPPFRRVFETPYEDGSWRPIAAFAFPGLED